MDCQFPRTPCFARRREPSETYPRARAVLRQAAEKGVSLIFRQNGRLLAGMLGSLKNRQTPLFFTGPHHSPEEERGVLEGSARKLHAIYCSRNAAGTSGTALNVQFSMGTFSA
jgi:hypothetical protein